MKRPTKRRQPKTSPKGTLEQLANSRQIQSALKGVVKQVGRHVNPKAILGRMKRPHDVVENETAAAAAYHPPAKRARSSSSFGPSPMSYRGKDIQRGAGGTKQKRGYLF
jgi:hypothetical protein